jgi:hypothetical protein
VARGVGKEHIDAALHHLFGGDAHTPFTTDFVDEGSDDSRGERAQRESLGHPSSMSFCVLVCVFLCVGSVYKKLLHAKPFPDGLRVGLGLGLNPNLSVG